MFWWMEVLANHKDVYSDSQFAPFRNQFEDSASAKVVVCSCALVFTPAAHSERRNSATRVSISERIVSKAYIWISPAKNVDFRRVFVVFDRVLEAVMRSSGEEQQKDPERCMQPGIALAREFQRCSLECLYMFIMCLQLFIHVSCVRL